MEKDRASVCLLYSGYTFICDETLFTSTACPLTEEYNQWFYT